MSVYITRGTSVFVEENAEDFSPLLPKGIYNVDFNPLQGFYLTRSPEYTKKSGKVYGDVTKRADRVITTYHDRVAKGMNTGVLLVGVKGSGKTMLTKKISEKLFESDISTIVVNATVDEGNVSAFTKFMNLFDSKIMVMFDEFEKNFSSSTQEQMLSMFDGISVNNKLFVFTSNNIWDVDTHMLNRPGRVFYRFDYQGLEEQFIKEYVNDVLINESLKQETIDKIVSSFKNSFTFDMLQSVVEEMNRFDQTLSEVIPYLNIDIHDPNYRISLFVDDKEVGTLVTKNIENFSIHDSVNKDHIYFNKDDKKGFNKSTKELHYQTHYSDRTYNAYVSLEREDYQQRNMFLGDF